MTATQRTASTWRSLELVEPAGGEVLAILPQRSLYTIGGKRMLDVVAATLALLVLALPMIVLAILVRIRLGPGVIYRQHRIGKAGAPFEMYKFTTMRADRRCSVQSTRALGRDRRVTHKSTDDPRHTQFGRVLRRSSLDELPQLFNVIKGNMSLVGPRPEVPNVVRNYEPWQHTRHRVRPGLTGPWQITERNYDQGRNMHRFVHLDVDYIANVSFRGDVKILAATVTGVVSGKFKGA